MDERGYDVLRRAVTPAALDDYARERAGAADGLLVRTRGSATVELLSQAPDDAGAVDPYAILPAARAVLLAEPILAALTARFGEPPLLFDAAETSAAAPEDGPYRDATYTALADDPDTLVTLVVALADGVNVDLYPGSHAIATTPFSGRYAHFNPERDGEPALAQHRAELTAALAEAEHVTLAAGDAALIAAGTVHHPVTGPAALVAHLVPARVRPGFFAYRPERARCAAAADRRAWLATQHYDLVDAVAPPEPPPAAAVAPVEDALREHDREWTTDAAPNPARRSGGLVDSVRGLLGRRGRS